MTKHEVHIYYLTGQYFRTPQISKLSADNVCLKDIHKSRLSISDSLIFVFYYYFIFKYQLLFGQIQCSCFTHSQCLSLTQETHNVSSPTKVDNKEDWNLIG